MKVDFLKKLLFLLLIFTLPFGFWFFTKTAGTQPSALITKPKPLFTPEILERGKSVFEKQCATCHDSEGRGNGDAAYLLYPKPRDFTTGEFRLISTTTGTATDEDLFKTIARGMPGSSMPPWSHLSVEDRWGLVYYVRHLSESGERGGQSKIDPADLIQPTPEPQVTPEALESGKALYTQGCASCHGVDGKGIVPQQMQDSQGYPIKARDFNQGIFKGGSDSHELYNRMVGGMPGAPMPSYAAAFSDQQIWDLIHYVQSFIKPGVQEKVEQKQTVIPVKKVIGDLSDDPKDAIWDQADSVYIALMPLWWQTDYTQGLEVKALHNGTDIAIQLAWEDPVKNDSVVRPQDFTDCAAIQFSLEPDPPFFGMGGGSPDKKSGRVNIWYWKASWQRDEHDRQDVNTQYPDMAYDFYPGQKNWQFATHPEIKKSGAQYQEPLNLAGYYVGNPLSDPYRSSAVEVVNARGQGTLTSQKYIRQNVRGAGIWKDGKWKVQFTRALNSETAHDVTLSSGATVNIAFAIWGGERGDRNGQKCVSIWHQLKLE